MNSTQLITIAVALVLLNFLWGFKSENPVTDTEQNTIVIKKERSTAEKSFYTVVLLIPLAICFWMTNIWFSAYNKSMKAAEWTVVSGKVTDKQVKNAIISGNTVNNNIRGSNYLPYIEYEYSLNGRKYSSTQISFLKQTEYYKEYDVEEYLSQFPDINHKINIYVNEYKDNFGVVKSDSALRVGKQDIEYTGVFITSFISLACLIILRLLHS